MILSHDVYSTAIRAPRDSKSESCAFSVVFRKVRIFNNDISASRLNLPLVHKRVFRPAQYDASAPKGTQHLARHSTGSKTPDSSESRGHDRDHLGRTSEMVPELEEEAEVE